MPNRKATGAVALALVLAVALAAWALTRGDRPQQAGSSSNGATMVAAVIPMSAAPADVQEAASRLMHSRVGYAMVRGGRTYLIVSTGAEEMRMKLAGFHTQGTGSAADGDYSFAEVDLLSDAAGSRLLILTVPTGSGVEYQFNLNASAAAIPTLVNKDDLPLVTLPSDARFVVLSPSADQLVSDGVIRVAGYARVFEAQFTVKVLSGKGRVLGEQHVMAAAGGPSWGSFTTEIRIDQADLSDAGFVVLEEGMTEAKLVIPVKFRQTAELG